MHHLDVCGVVHHMNPVATAGSGMTPETFSIGALARTTDMKVETVRYCERIGLLPSPARTAGNDRAYLQPHLEQLMFIRRGRDLGFSLGALRELLRLSDDRHRPRREFDQVARTHLSEVESKIADLTALRGELRQLIEQSNACDIS